MLHGPMVTAEIIIWQIKSHVAYVRSFAMKLVTISLPTPHSIMERTFGVLYMFVCFKDDRMQPKVLRILNKSLYMCDIT